MVSVSLSGMIMVADIGTSSLKVGFITLKGELSSFVRVAYERPPLRSSFPVIYDFEPEEWERALARALKALPATRIEAIALSGNGPTVVACTRDGKPLSPLSLWMEDSDIAIPGQLSCYLPRVARLRRKAGKPWPSGTRIFTCPEWLQFRLGGRAEMGIPSLAFQPYVWDEQQINVYGLQDLVFPRMRPMGSFAGTVSASASSHYGLAEGTPLVLAGSDFLVALLGTGTIEPGLVCDRAGTSETVNFCCASPPEELAGGDTLLLQAIPHVAEPNWNLAAKLNCTGAGFEWYRSVTGQKGKDYDRIIADISRLPLDSDIPLFVPGRSDCSFWDFNEASMVGLKPFHDAAHIGRAIMHSMCYALKQALEKMKESGLEIEELRVSGGQAGCREWNQMKSDVTSCVVTVPEVPDAELVGGACCAALALGRYDSLPEASRACVRMGYSLEPREEYQLFHEESCSRYRAALQKVVSSDAC